VEFKLFELVTGEKMTQDKLNDRAARIWNMHRLVTALEWGGGKPVNLRQEHDQLPEHFFAPVAGRVLPVYPEAEPPHPPLDRKHFEATKAHYYTYMGWDAETGLPRRATLEKLGMKDVAEAFEAKAFQLPA